MQDLPWNPCESLLEDALEGQITVKKMAGCMCYYVNMGIGNWEFNDREQQD